MPGVKESWNGLKNHVTATQKAEGWFPQPFIC